MAEIDIVGTLQGLNTRSQVPFFESDIGFTPGDALTNPDTVISKALRDKVLRLYQFPSDIPPHHFTILQGEAIGSTAPIGSNVTQVGNFSAAYKLPMPTTIVNRHSVKYDHSFNWLGAASKLLGLAGTASTITSIAGGLGYSVNTFKAVTLAVPEFKMFQLEWRLFPKSHQESMQIQRLAIALQTGMTPSTTDVLGASFTYNFPSIFVPYFTTGIDSSEGSRYLFKFKPCVCSGCEINYQGDQPVPAFYKNSEDQAIPEGIVLRTNWIELEVWSKANFTNSMAADDLYNENPFSAVNG